jgi:hypothetical protein
VRIYSYVWYAHIFAHAVADVVAIAKLSSRIHRNATFSSTSILLCVKLRSEPKLGPYDI